MKKYILLLIVALVILLSSCQNNNPKSNTDTSTTFPSITTKQNESRYEGNTKIMHPEIEKVILDYCNIHEEITEKEIAFDFIDKIQSRTTVPKEPLRIEIGQMKIKYYDSNDITDFAVLYCDSYGNIYAKHVDSLDKNFAYQLGNT